MANYQLTNIHTRKIISENVTFLGLYMSKYVQQKETCPQILLYLIRRKLIYNEKYFTKYLESSRPFKMYTFACEVVSSFT